MMQDIPDTSTPKTAEMSTKKRRKASGIFKAAISFVLCFAMFVQMISPELVWAASDALTSENGLVATESVPYENTILFEDPSLREENKKEYRMSDGSYKAIVYPQPIHYEEYGEWQDIDNTLYLNESAGGYTNAASDFSVTFAKKSDSKKLVEIKTDDYKLSWGFVGSNDNKSAKKKTKVTSDDATALNNLSDGLYYNDIYNDVDVEYILESKTLKENIILKTKNARQSFVLELKLNNATAVLNSDRTVSIILSDGTEAAKFAAPFMYDAKGVHGQDVAVSLTGSGNKYTLTLTPSKEWLNDENRAYPVTIDPVVTHNRYNAFTDGLSKSFLDGYIYGENYYVGKYYNSNQNAIDEVYSFWYVFSEFWYESEIRKAYLCVDTAPRNSSMWTGDTYNNVTINKSISAHALSTPYESLEDKENVSISQPFDIVNVSVDYSTTNSNSSTVCKFDITDYIYSDFFDNTDRFLMLQEYNPPTTVASGTMPIKFLNARMEFDYRSPDGVEEYLTYTEASVGEAGTIYINDATGNVVYAHSGITTPSVTMPISVGNIYQNGKWSTNFSETLYKYNSTEEINSLTEYVDKTYADAGYPYSWVDSDGTTIYFHKDKELDENGNEVDVIVDETGKRIKLTELYNGYVELKDAEENVSTFAPYGENQYRLIRKTDVYGNSIYVDYTSSASAEIYDFTNDYGERIAIAYNENGKPSCMVEITESGDVLQRNDYAYDAAGNLTEITRDDGKKTILSYSGTKLTGVLDTATGYMVKLVYENNKITLKEYANVPETMDTTSASEGQSMVMTFNGSSTSFRTPGVNGIMEDGENSDDILTVYQFDTYLRTVSAYSKSYVGNKFYGAEQQEYTSGGLIFSGSSATNGDQKYGFNKIKSTVSVGKATENLLANGSFEYSLSPDNPNPVDLCGTFFDCNDDMTGMTESDFVYTSIFDSMSVDQALSGEKMLSVSITESGLGFKNAWYAPIARSSTLKPNTEYTFSAYVRRTSSSGLGSRLAVLIGETEHLSSYQSTTSTSEWERLEVHFTTPSVLTDDVQFCIESSTTSTVFVDCVLLEEGAAANAYNYADNQGFEATYTDSANTPNPFFWNGNGIISTNSTYFGNNAISVVGNPSANKTVTQTITLGNRYNAPQGRDITISAWAKADALPEAEHTPNRFFGIKARLVYAEAEGNTSYSEIQESSFNYFTNDWQFASLSLSSDETKTLLAVELTLAYNYQIGTCLFDNISVVDNTVTNYEYDGLGNLTRIKAGDEETVNDYDEMQLVSSTDLNKDEPAETEDATTGTSTLEIPDPYNEKAPPMHTLELEGEVNDEGEVVKIDKIVSATQNVRDLAGKTLYTQTGTELLAYYKFIDDEIVNVSGNPIPSAFSSGVSFVEGEGYEEEQSARFNGNSYIKINGLELPDYFTIVFDAAIHSGFDDCPYFISKYDINGNLLFGIYNGGGLVVQSGYASSYVTNRVGVSPTNVAVSFEKHSESKTVVRIYVNGVQEFSQPFDTALIYGTGELPLYIGASVNNGVVTNGLDGEMDNIAFFRGVLSKEEIMLVNSEVYMQEHVFKQTAEWTEYTYSDDGRYLISEENSDGSSVSYIIDEETGLTKSVITYNKADGTVRMNYEYNLDKSLKLVYYDSDRDGVRDSYERYIAYTYDARGNLTSVNALGEVYSFAYNEWGQNTSVSTIDRTLMSYAYPTVNGKAINATITGQSFGGNSAQTQEFVYDALGNIVGRKSNGTLTQKYAYDNNGNLVSEIDSEDGTSARYQYDAQSRLTQTNRNLLGGYTGVTSYLYNDNSNVTRAGYTIFGTDLNYTISSLFAYDADGKFISADSNGVRAETLYNETDEITDRIIKDIGTDSEIASESYQYYDRTENGGIKGALKEISYGTNNSFSYTYDAVGRIKTELKNGVLNREYVYDKMGQLVQECIYDPDFIYSYTGSAYYFRVIFDYSYNTNGNLEEWSGCAEGIDEDGNTDILPIDHGTYGYYDSGQEYWLSPLMYDGNEEIAYDNMGNPLNYFGKNFTWENGRELATITNRSTGAAIASYEYDAAGLRISKNTTAGGTVYYVYDENSNLIFEKHSDYTLAFYYDGNGIRTHFTKKSSTGYESYYYRYNLQGDVIALLNDSGTVVAEYNYTAYGKPIGTITEIGSLNPFRYRGYYFDSETDFYYLQSRYYDPYTCRFINADAAEFIGATGTPLSYNLFLYCENDPVNNTDPSGHLSASQLANRFSIAAILGMFMATMSLSFSKGLVAVSGYSLKIVTPLAIKAFWWKPILAAAIIAATVAIIVAAVTIAYNATIKNIKSKIPKKIQTSDGRVDLSKFNTKLKNGGWRGPDGWEILKDTAKHAGTVWKLYRYGKRIASLWGDGRIRGK